MLVVVKFKVGQNSITTVDFRHVPCKLKTKSHILTVNIEAPGICH